MAATLTDDEKKKSDFITQCGWFTRKTSHMHRTADVYVLRLWPCHGNDRDGFTLLQRWMLLIKMIFHFSNKQTKKYKRRRITLASIVVSCDGVLCVKEVGASVQQGRLYKPLADFILIYELLFPMTYSIFISYIYLF